MLWGIIIPKLVHYTTVPFASFCPVERRAVVMIAGISKSQANCAERQQGVNREVAKKQVRMVNHSIYLKYRVHNGRK
jgi:hypothetical protein